MNYPKVSVVLINYNGKELLERFFISIVNLNYPDYKLIIVDNASTDASINFLKEKYPKAKVISADKNYGTAEGGNIGARQAEGDYIFFISNDMELDKNILNFMVERMEKDKKIGICTCKMRRITEFGDKLNIIDSVGSDLDVFGFPAARGINEKDFGQLDYFTEVFFSFGGALLIRKDLFFEAGGYDPEVFTLADDIDLSWRVRLLGYKVVVEPKAFLYHRVSATLGSKFKRSQKRFISERNTLRMLLKDYGLFGLLFILPGYMCLLAAEVSFFLMLGKKDLSISGLRAIWWNIKYLSDTWRRRAVIQARRVMGDLAVLKCMRLKSHKLEIFMDYLKHYSSVEWRGYFG
ncbi:MAG: glycosyltransferase [Candidatus Omnitrophica bacterium]|nr:glycosyltransferase [Candidatus Omnitrophota bacterium]